MFHLAHTHFFPFFILIFFLLLAALRRRRRRLAALVVVVFVVGVVASLSSSPGSWSSVVLRRSSSSSSSPSVPSSASWLLVGRSFSVAAAKLKTPLIVVVVVFPRLPSCYRAKMVAVKHFIFTFKQRFVFFVFERRRSLR